MATKTELVRFRLTPDEKDRLERHAAAASMTVSEFVRKVVLDPRFALRREVTPDFK